MLSSWLKSTERNSPAFTKFTINDIIEHGNKNDDPIKSYLKSLFMNNTTNHQLFEKIAKKWGYESTYKSFFQSSQPTKPRLAKGRFGEILLAGILSEFFGYVIPVHKLAYTLARNESPHATDIFAIKFNGNQIVEVCYVESKLRIKKDSRALVLAYEQLMKDQNEDVPIIIKFVMNVLEDKNEGALLDSLISYFSPQNSSRINDTFCIGAIYDNNTWEESSLDLLHRNMDNEKKFYIDVVKIADLETYLKEYYDFIGVELDEE